jgi:hypothetical protein
MTGVELVVGDQVEDVQPGEREALRDARRDARLLRRGTELLGEFRFA